MSFWAYMLHCADRTFYVGHTDDLEKRIGQHELGLIPGYTSTRRPVRLVWSEVFSTRTEAREAEERLKGWGRPKKLALIRGDWPLICELAKGTKEGASTSSAKPVSAFLHPHLDHLPSETFALEATVRTSGARSHISYRLTGPVELVRVPQRAEAARGDGLWQHTCFEVFRRNDVAGPYLELNFSPSTEWAAYRFRSRREGMETLAIPAPQITVAQGKYSLELRAIVNIREAFPVHLNLSAVIEEKSGHKSYWALAHPPSGPPDFHHPACFVLELPPAPAA